jgi:23S rRNA (guanosine2251-2'-O)-methyltransferase
LNENAKFLFARPLTTVARSPFAFAAPTIYGVVFMKNKPLQDGSPAKGAKGVNPARTAAARSPTGRPKRQSGRGPLEPDRIWIYGVHAVEAALANPNRRIFGFYATQNAVRRVDPAILANALSGALSDAIAPTILPPAKIDALLPTDSVHQGLAIETEILEEPRLQELVPRGPLVLLDQVTDPQNVGAILRSAAAFGAAAVVVTARHAPLPAGALAKAATGALEHVPYLRVTNLARTLAFLNDEGYRTIGLAGEAEDDLSTADDGRPLALVLGSEGKGLRQLTRQTCTDLARIPLAGRIGSLNVSNAAAVALYIATRDTAT